jgi:hypothetical protein
VPVSRLVDGGTLSADEWEIVRIDESGNETVAGSLARFDLATRWALQIAESYARNDHGRVALGKPCSGTRAILVSHDLLVIDHSRPTPVILAVPSAVPRQRIREAARELLHAYR